MKQKIEPINISPKRDFNDDSIVATFIEKQQFEAETLPYNSTVDIPSGVIVVAENEKAKKHIIKDDNKVINPNVREWWFDTKRFGYDTKVNTIYFINKQFLLTGAVPLLIDNPETGRPYSDSGIVFGTMITVEEPLILLEGYSLGIEEYSSISNFKGRLAKHIGGIVKERITQSLKEYHSESEIIANRTLIISKLNRDCETAMSHWGISLKFTSIENNPDPIDKNVANHVAMVKYENNN